MCGVLSWTSVKREFTSNKFEAALSEIKHRGPDNQDFISIPIGFLGHSRLSIIDLSDSGNQPMTSSSQNYSISFNGEIFNFENLRKYLDKKYSINWASDCDTEVLLTGYEKEGSDFFNLLNGMYAILLYNHKSSELIFARDPQGIKPLYIYKNSKDTILCSELAPIKKLVSKESLSIRKKSLLDQLLFTYVPEPFSMYNEILKVEPGKVFNLKNNQIELIQEICPSEFKLGEINADRLNEVLESSIKRQLVSDVPITCLLSGGLDSSILTKIASQHAELNQVYNLRILGEDIKLDDQTDDYHYAQKVADSLGVKMTTIKADESFLDDLELMVDILEDGIADPAALSMLKLCEQISRDKFKVVLLGQGPDEYMMGYRRHIAWKILANNGLRYALKISRPLIRVFKGKSAFLRRLEILSELSLLDEKDRFRRLFYWTDPIVLRRIFNLTEEYFNDTLESIILDNESNLSFNVEKADQKLDLLSLNLHYSDRICMKFGLEGRVPYLDNQMIEAYSKLNVNQKLNGFRSKHLLKEVGELHFGKDIVNRKKAGFSLPIRAWFQKSNVVIEKFFKRESLESCDLFDVEFVLSLLKETQMGIRDHSYTLWVILVQLIWLDKNKDYSIQ